MLACGNSGRWMLTYTAMDDCGNTASDIQYITIEDTTPPSITANADAQVECGEDFDLSGYEASDLCGNVTVDVDSVFAPTCGNAGVWTLTYTATDDCGNSASDVQIITILDTTPPSITCPADAVVDCATGSTDPSETGSATGDDTVVT